MHSLPDLFRVLILGVVEGITEFLPVSSTGHMLLVERWMHLPKNDEFWKTFTVFIQIGAILAVIVYFRERLLGFLRGNSPATNTSAGNVGEDLPVPTAPTPPDTTPTGTAAAGTATVTPAAALDYQTARPDSWPIILVLIATIPVLIVGFLAKHWIDKHMEGSATVIGLTLGVGGAIMIGIELMRPVVTTTRIEHMSLGQAIGIGLTQILAVVFPGTSRSAATIMPGMLFGLSREAATEFSFFLAIPAMFAACGYSLLKYLKSHPHLSADNLLLLAIGTLVSFLVAWAVIAAFMRYIRRNNFISFGVYRIALAVVVFAYWHFAR